MSGTDGLCRPSLSAAQFTRKVFGYLLVTLSTGAVIDLSQSGCLTVRACVQLERCIFLWGDLFWGHRTVGIST